VINDSGTHFINKLPSIDPQPALTPQALIDRARLAKVKVLDLRIDAGDRGFPAYLDSNRFPSNLPATTTFFPVVDLSHQYINGLMYDTAEACGRSKFLSKGRCRQMGSQGLSECGYQDTAARDHADIEHYDKYFSQRAHRCPSPA